VSHEYEYVHLSKPAGSGDVRIKCSATSFAGIVGVGAKRVRVPMKGSCRSHVERNETTCANLLTMRLTKSRLEIELFATFV
jgi:hypothetical protein